MVCHAIQFNGNYLALREYDYQEMFGENSKYAHSDTYLSLNCMKENLQGQLDDRTLDKMLERYKEKLREHCPE